MSFSIAQIIGQDKPVIEHRKIAQPDFICPTGKKPFATKADAREVARRTHGHHQMRPFRCGYCEHYHLGHQRGTIL